MILTPRELPGHAVLVREDLPLLVPCRAGPDTLILVRDMPPLEEVRDSSAGRQRGFVVGDVDHADGGKSSFSVPECRCDPLIPAAHP